MTTITRNHYRCCRRRLKLRDVCRFGKGSFLLFAFFLAGRAIANQTDVSDAEPNEIHDLCIEILTCREDGVALNMSIPPSQYSIDDNKEFVWITLLYYIEKNEARGVELKIPIEFFDLVDDETAVIEGVFVVSDPLSSRQGIISVELLERQ